MKPTSFGMVVRYLLLDRVTYLVLPWAWAAFGFVVDVVIVQLIPAGSTSHRWVGGLVGVFIVVFALGVQAVARALPFGLTPGVSAAPISRRHLARCRPGRLLRARARARPGR